MVRHIIFLSIFLLSSCATRERPVKFEEIDIIQNKNELCGDSIFMSGSGIFIKKSGVKNFSLLNSIKTQTLNLEKNVVFLSSTKFRNIISRLENGSEIHFEACLSREDLFSYGRGSVFSFENSYVVNKIIIFRK